MEPITKLIDFGKVAYSSKQKRNLVEVEIELRNKDKAIHWQTLEEITDVPELSICGQVWNSVHSDHEMGGQCIDSLVELLPHNKLLKRIKEIWEEYHLNDMNAGTKKQTEFLDKLKASGWKYDYNSACDSLKEAGLYEENGFKYGHGWLYRPIPENILNEIKEICK